MNRRFLIMVATICGAVALVSLILLPLVSTTYGENSSSARAIKAGGAGGFLLIFSALATSLCGLVFLKRTEFFGMDEKKHIAFGFLFFKLLFIMLLALLIDGAGGEKSSFGVGFWFAFLGSLVGTAALFLTFNPGLAKKLAEVAKADDEPPASA